MTSVLLLLTVLASVLALAVLYRERAPAQPGSSSRLQPREASSSLLSAFSIARGRAQADEGRPSYATAFSWTVFITPQGFVGAADRRQRRAIESWLRLTVRRRRLLQREAARERERERKREGGERARTCLRASRPALFLSVSRFLPLSLSLANLSLCPP